MTIERVAGLNKEIARLQGKLARGKDASAFSVEDPIPGPVARFFLPSQRRRYAALQALAARDAHIAMRQEIYDDAHRGLDGARERLLSDLPHGTNDLSLSVSG